MFSTSEHVQGRYGRSFVASIVVHIAAVIAIVSVPLYVVRPRLEPNPRTATEIVFPVRAPVSTPREERPVAAKVARMRQPPGRRLVEMPAERAALVRTPQPRIEPRGIEPPALPLEPLNVLAPDMPRTLEQVRPATPPAREELQIELGGFGSASAATRAANGAVPAEASESFRPMKPDRQGGRWRTTSYERSGFGAAGRGDGRSPKDVETAGNAEAGSSFGSATASSPAGGPAGLVHDAGFGQVVAGEQRIGEQGIEAERAVEPAPASSAARVLAKPMPQYTDEARQLRIEGDVRLRVNFRADATVEVLQVIEGLGHGLDESAVRAARQIEFAPAEQSSKPVDFVAEVFIRFRLAY